MDDTSKLTQLGSQSTDYKFSRPHSSMLETFPNKYPKRDYWITHKTDEFSSLCPKTFQPDFASADITYIAKESCVESKSLKLYMFSYRNEGSFMETICNRVLEDLVTACNPKYMRVTFTFKARGGIQTIVSAEFGSH
jgi:7-cyano-7-deazaguanine reductase